MHAFDMNNHSPQFIIMQKKLTVSSGRESFTILLKGKTTQNDHARGIISQFLPQHEKCPLHMSNAV